MVIEARPAAAAAVLLCAIFAMACADSSGSGECDETLATCGESCVDLGSDPENCGACGVVCDGACDDGVCRQAAACPEATGCAMGDAVVAAQAGAFVDEPVRGTDLSPPSCEAGEMCDGVCVDLDSDPTHCGACGVVCPGGVCGWGVCYTTGGF